MAALGPLSSLESEHILWLIAPPLASSGAQGWASRYSLALQFQAHLALCVGGVSWGVGVFPSFSLGGRPQ